MKTISPTASTPLAICRIVSLFFPFEQVDYITKKSSP